MFKDKFIVIVMPAFIYACVTIILYFITKYIFHVWMPSFFFKASLISILSSHALTYYLTAKTFSIVNSIIASAFLLLVSFFIYYYFDLSNSMSSIVIVGFIALGFVSIFVDKSLSRLKHPKHRK